MATRAASLASKTSTLASSEAPGTTSGSELTALDRLRGQKEAEDFVSWVKSEFSRAKDARSGKERQWFTNMSFFYGRQWLSFTSKNLPQGLSNKLINPKTPYYNDRKTVNRIRSFVRTEISKFVSQEPTALAVPASAEEGDVRAAYAAEQVFQAIAADRNLRRTMTRSAWWMVLTGNGFTKTWWDRDADVDGDKGQVTYGMVTPFNLYVPDVREQEIEDQPFVINAYTWPVEKCYLYFKDALKGVNLVADDRAGSDILDDAKLNLNAGTNKLKSIVVYELWAKPGAHRLLPNGGYAVVCGETLVAFSEEGLPYQHGQYPFTKTEHINTETFYADSPLVDLIELQKEYNQWRTEIAYNGKVAARPKLLAVKGSITPSKITNEPGQIIEVQPGFQMPQWQSVTALPDWYMAQGDRLLQDFEDISGQHEVSRGQAPAGVTAGTALNYLAERDDQYLTEQYRNVEDSWKKIAQQTLQLFNQYVDLPRKIKTVGTDGAFDTVVLQGADIKNGLDVRIEPGSAISQSKAARDARFMELFSIGAITDPNQLLKLMEVGGSQKIIDTINVAEKKAQRENLKMKMLDAAELEQQEQQVKTQLQEHVVAQMQQGLIDPEEGQRLLQEDFSAMFPPAIPVDDFDVHEVHIDVHNRFRMSQEYEALPEIVRAQYERHVKAHEEALQQKQFEQAQADLMAQGQNPAEPFAAEEAELMGGEGHEHGAEPGMEEEQAAIDAGPEPGATMAATEPPMGAL